MKKSLPRFALMASMLCILSFYSCSSDDGSDQLRSPLHEGRDQSSSSDGGVKAYCVYMEERLCFSTAYPTCPSNGILVDVCPFGSSSSAEESGQSSSSAKAELEYGYCVFAAEKACLDGPISSCPPGAELSNVCPYSSSSSNVVAPSSSSAKAQSSSATALVSSSSIGVGVVVGNVFIDPRDSKNYKFEIAPNGKIWMSENLNYSKNNTLGYCYGVDINGANPHRDSTSCGSGYGRIYDYATATDGNLPQGLCPNGWHIPSRAEWSDVVGTTTRKMSSDFYIYPGNYNLNTEYPPIGWKERDKSGFYWTSSGNTYFTGFFNGSYCKAGTECLVEAQTGASVIDNWSVRCIANDDFKLTCGTVAYNPAKEFCSGSKTYALCGGKSYKPETEFCSGTAIYPLCDGQTYNPSTSQCEGSKLYSKCGTMLYSSLTHFCSGTTIYELCGGKPYNPAAEECSGGIVIKQEDICGSKPYYLETHFCYDDKLYTLCGGKTYNPTTQECVDDVPLYQIICINDIRETYCNSAAGGITLKTDECVEIKVLDYTNESYLPTVGIRCDAVAGGYGSFTVSVNGKLTTVESYDGLIPLGTIKVGDNEFGTLCLMAGATSIKCRGPGF